MGAVESDKTQKNVNNNNNVQITDYKINEDFLLTGEGGNFPGGGYNSDFDKIAGHSDENSDEIRKLDAIIDDFLEDQSREVGGLEANKEEVNRPMFKKDSKKSEKLDTFQMDDYPTDVSAFTENFKKVAKDDFFSLKKDRYQFNTHLEQKKIPGTYQTELSLRMKLKIIRIPDSSLVEQKANQKSIFVDADTNKFHWFLYIGGQSFFRFFDTERIHKTINFLNAYDESELVSFRVDARILNVQVATNVNEVDLIMNEISKLSLNNGDFDDEFYQNFCSLKHGYIFSRAWVMLFNKMSISARNLPHLQEIVHEKVGPLNLCEHILFEKNKAIGSDQPAGLLNIGSNQANLKKEAAYFEQAINQADLSLEKMGKMANNKFSLGPYLLEDGFPEPVLAVDTDDLNTKWQCNVDQTQENVYQRTYNDHNLPKLDISPFQILETDNPEDTPDFTFLYPILSNDKSFYEDNQEEILQNWMENLEETLFINFLKTNYGPSGLEMNSNYKHKITILLVLNRKSPLEIQTIKNLVLLFKHKYGENVLFQWTETDLNDKKVMAMTTISKIKKDKKKDQKTSNHIFCRIDHFNLKLGSTFIKNVRKNTYYGKGLYRPYLLNDGQKINDLVECGYVNDFDAKKIEVLKIFDSQLYLEE